MIAALPANVPIFLDRLRHPSEERFFQFLRTSYPELQERYQYLAATDTDAYCEGLKQQYRDDPRIKFVFGEA